MSFWELLLVAVGLSMDAFAVAVCAGLTMPKFTVRKSLTVGLYFGVFQAVMPLAGYMLATRFAERIRVFDHWVAFTMLCFIGGKMLGEGIKEEEYAKGHYSDKMSLKPSKMLPLAIATSIDALAVGITFAFLQVSIITAAAAIGMITLAVSMAGVKIGNMFGTRMKSKAELAGGVILVLMGVKILLEHTGFIRL